MSEAKKDVSPVTVGGDEVLQVTEQRRGTPIAKLLPWLLGVCLIGFLGLAAIGTYEALTGSRAFARATPTPSFSAGTEVKLVDREDGPVTIWQVGGSCEVGLAFGQVPSGSDARILDDACYHAQRQTYYHFITLPNGSTGWVEADQIVPAAEYTPPPPTGTPEPTDTPWPTPTPPPTPTATPRPLPMGSSLSTGNWGVRVDRVEIADSLSSLSGDKTVEAVGRFALVYLTVTNRGPRLETLHASSVYIEDAEGNRYLNDDLASALASTVGCPDFALDISPDESACMVAAVDVPEQSRFYLLSLHGADEYVLLDVP